MKRILITLLIIAVLSVAGILYGNHGNSDERKSVSLEEAYKAQYPVEFPEVVMQPVTGFSF